MVDFRRVITVLGILVLFVGLAGAQPQMTCNTNVTVTPQLRGEGYTEQTGDITITCTGGAPIAPGGNIPLANFAVFYNTTVTSRLLPTTTPQSSNSTSEALLMIDEPGSGLKDPNNQANLLYGAALPQILCTSPLQGCTASAGFTATPAGATPPIGTVAVVPGTNNPAPNVYQGVVSGASVVFNGVPVLPPTTNGSRVYRITNVRVNAQPLAGGSASGATAVSASISISNVPLSISNSIPNVGFVSPSLNGSAGNFGNLQQCTTQTKTAISTISFSENFATAFKTRVVAQTNTSYAGQINTPAQNIPGGIYNSESNFVFPINANQTAGLADFGTRLKATFNNIPAGATLWVSTVNVQNATVALGAIPNPAGGSAANANPAGSGAYTGYAQLISNESQSDGNAGGGFFPVVINTDNAGAIPIAQVSLANGTGSAVWEVINTNPTTNDTFKFGVYLSYTSNVAQNVPLPGQATVNLSYAPTATSGAASASLPLPRFAGDQNAARNLFNIGICRTILLYPYVTNQAGFDTGLTVANTTQDPYTIGSNVTGAQAGSCKFTWYGGTTAAPTTPPTPYDTGSIAAGTVWANTLQTVAPNFQGYAFAICNFQFAHGFAFISDVGARNLAMGYLAVVLNDPGSNARPNANTTTAENGGH